MSQEQQTQIDALTQRVAELERTKSTPGPRGPAGDIDAAVRNAEEASRAITGEAITKHTVRVNDLDQMVRRAVADLGKAVADAKAHFEAVVRQTEQRFFQNAEANLNFKILNLLKDYDVLDSETSTPVTKHLEYAIGQVLNAREAKPGITNGPTKS